MIRSRARTAVLVAALTVVSGCGRAPRGAPPAPPETPPRPAVPERPAPPVLTTPPPAPTAAVRAPAPAAAEPTGAVRASRGMVVSEHPLASRVGRDVLAAGGNAVDAAVATGFALAVTHPSAGNVGGGGFMVIRFPDGRSTALDFREKAPLAAHPRMFLEDGEYSRALHHDSWLAVGVPGTVAGLDSAHVLYGTGDWSRLVRPAVDLAEYGFVVDERLARSLNGFLEGKARNAAARAAFAAPDGAWSEGEVLRQPDLAATLRRVMERGRAGFYEGETARLVAAEMARGGGWINEEDLARYRARERTPVRGRWGRWEVLSMPPPSSGGVALVEMLNILEGYDLAAMGHGSAAYVHHLAEAMRLAYRDRARWLADTDFVDVPVERLTSKAYGAGLRAGIAPGRAGRSDPGDVAADDAVRPESPETTHYSVVDADGMAVSVTYTLEQGYGSGIVVAGAGFLLNNEMGDFNAAPGLTTSSGLIGTDANLARPEQRMLSSMTPTILARDGELAAVIGSPGGRTIINTVLQVALGIMAFGMDIEEAVAAPRLHHQWLPDRIRVEEGRFAPEVIEALEAMGHTVQVGGRQGTAHSIMVDPATGVRVGMPDPRNPQAGAAGH